MWENLSYMIPTLSGRVHYTWFITEAIGSDAIIAFPGTGMQKEHAV